MTPHRLHSALAGLLLVALGAPLAAIDFEAERRAAWQAMDRSFDQSFELWLDGRTSEVCELLERTFDADARTPVQAFVLGHHLFSLDPARSYALHREAALALPDEPFVLFEWAKQQQRKGESAGALAAYDRYVELRPDGPLAHGLAAECLLRLGRPRDAAARWARYEATLKGSLEPFERQVGKVFGTQDGSWRRQALRAKAERGDLDAAVALIVLGCRWEFDWWDRRPSLTFLDRDLPLLDALPAGPRVTAARCAALVCTLGAPEGKTPDADAMRALLAEHALLVDADATLPEDGALASLLVAYATRSGVWTAEEAAAQVHDRAIARARATADVDWWDLATRLSVDGPATDSLDREAWLATGDARFAASWLARRLRSQSPLAADDPLLAEALTQFPEHADIAAIALAVRPHTVELLSQALLAEYRKFSVSEQQPFPRAVRMRGYFREMGKAAEEE